ncbi:putative GTPase activating protein [Trypanosoma theileri]|uniref:Putative GTPase activating protein n=1 Tax=Trypanosoma theileri TaxID=67003 RepID=A0A1X0NVX6_9TRYP|nr:putative GTPase activating protein [Trypanosoma theileri]ORC88688.1 putative GTPase activating protein [Trypanosoma theileri]
MADDTTQETTISTDPTPLREETGAPTTVVGTIPPLAPPIATAAGGGGGGGGGGVLTTVGTIGPLYMNMNSNHVPNSSLAEEKDDISHSVRVFEELLDAEVLLNPAKLREASRAGIPVRYRSTVYRYLLGVAFVDKSREMTLERMQEKDFERMEATFGRIAAGGEGGGLAPLTDTAVPLLGRHESPFASGGRCTDKHAVTGNDAWAAAYARMKILPTLATDQERRNRFRAAVHALQVANSDATPDAVEHIFALARVFETVHKTARDIYFSTQTLYHLLTHHGNVLQSPVCLQRECGTFLMLFRATNFELYRHFMSEGVTVVEWLPDMLSTLLAGRLHDDDVLRLWDAYLADALEQLCIPLHPYVCLAILADMTEVLLECEKSGIVERLRRLPRIKAGSIIQKAISLRESVFSKGLL